MANNAGTGGKRQGRSSRLPRLAEDDYTNVKTGRPLWDEHAPDQKDPGRSDTAAANHIVDAYVSQQNRKQRKLIGRA